MIKDFITAALPWICMGLLLAIFFARSPRRKDDNDKKENYGTEGMCLGMCFGTAIGTSIGNNTGIGLTLGMLLGLAIGSCIEKKDERKEMPLDTESRIQRHEEHEKADN